MRQPGIAVLAREVKPPTRRRDPRLAIATAAAVIASAIVVAQCFKLDDRAREHRIDVERIERLVSDELRFLGLYELAGPIHCTGGAQWRTDGTSVWCQR